MAYFCNQKTRNVWVEIVALLILLQGGLLLAKGILMPFLPDTLFSEKMVSMATMLLLSLFFVRRAMTQRVDLAVFPKKFGKGYVLGTCVTALLYISAPANFLEGIPAILGLLYGSLVTPIFEELLFRGYVWDRTKQVLAGEKAVYVWNTVLFALWHLGYMTPQLAQGNWTAVLGKVLAGAGYGAVLGFVRLKTKNCYATMLLHGILNLFMV